MADGTAKSTAGGGAGEATERLWREHHAGLRGFIRGRVGDAAAADDILQDVFLKVHTGLATLRDRDRIAGWLYRVARNAVIDHYRARRPHGPLPDGLAAPEGDAAARARREIESCLEPLIRRLPDIYRRALMLAEIEGRTRKDVAASEGLSLPGAKARVRRGRAMVKEALTACCRFDFDHRGTLVDYQRRGGGCPACEPALAPSASFSEPVRLNG